MFLVGDRYVGLFCDICNQSCTTCKPNHRRLFQKEYSLYNRSQGTQNCFEDPSEDCHEIVWLSLPPGMKLIAHLWNEDVVFLQARCCADKYQIVAEPTPVYATADFSELVEALQYEIIRSS